MTRITFLFIAVVGIAVSTPAAYAGMKACQDGDLLTQIVRRDSHLYIPSTKLDPPLLLGRLESGGKRHALAAIEVKEPEQLCRIKRCVKLFESRRVKKLEPGMRALVIAEVDRNCNVGRTTILWGSGSVLVLQPDRTGEGLWEVVKQGDHDAFQLVTEATQGRIMKEKQRLIWQEDPDQ